MAVRYRDVRDKMKTIKTKLDEVDRLKLQNIALRMQLLEKEREILGADLLRRYGAPGDDTLRVNNDGTINRSPRLTETPEQ